MSMQFAFDAFTLAEIAALAQFPAYVGLEVDAALFEGAKIFAQAAIDNTWRDFKNPTGVLASDIVALMEAHFQSAVTSGVPYAWRREEGFSGQTDALGRFYPYDPGIHYMQNAFDDKELEVYALVQVAVATALSMATLGGG
jgi:hypothetical protein